MLKEKESRGKRDYYVVGWKKIYEETKEMLHLDIDGLLRRNMDVNKEDSMARKKLLQSCHWFKYG